MTHEHHPEIIKRLKRADGHLQMIIKMIEEGRSGVQLPSNCRRSRARS
jgi:DNA-binding FrmR family transcriptional regulator